jgi:hypothetical protein
MLGFHILPSTSTEKTFGPDSLPSGPLRKDQKAVIPLLQILAGRTCLYDMKADFQGGNTEQRYRVNICEVSPGFAASSQPGIALPGAGAGPRRRAMTCCRPCRCRGRRRLPCQRAPAWPPGQAPLLRRYPRRFLFRM